VADGFDSVLVTKLIKDIRAQSDATGFTPFVEHQGSSGINFLVREIIAATALRNEGETCIVFAKRLALNAHDRRRQNFASVSVLGIAIDVTMYSAVNAKIDLSCEHLLAVKERYEIADSVNSTLNAVIFLRKHQFPFFN